MNARKPNICICPQAHRFSVWSSKLRTCIVLSHTACSKGRIQWTVSPSFSVLNSPLGTLVHFERAMSASVAGGNCQTWQTAELLPFSKPSQVIDWEKKEKLKKANHIWENLLLRLLLTGKEKSWARCEWEARKKWVRESSVKQKCC